MTLTTFGLCVTLGIATFFCVIFPMIHSSATENGCQQNGDLLFVHVLYRHGERNPIGQNPGDDYDISYWPEGWGELTNLGMQQHYALGQWLRRRYNNFLSSTYNVNDIYVRSSDVERTLMSAQANLAGLYPPKGKQIWNKNLLWQPIPVHTLPRSTDYLIGGFVPESCLAFENAYTKYWVSPDMLTFQASMQSVYDYLTANTGEVVNDSYVLSDYYDSWFIESNHHLTLPEWTKQLYPNNAKVYQAVVKSYAFSSTTKFLAKFSGGFLLKDILDRCTSKIQDELMPNRKMWMYSSHDGALFSFLNSLGISDNKLVPYAAAIIVELRHYKNENYIQIFYKNSDKTPQPMKIPGCGISCPLPKMYKIYDNILPKNNFTTECQIEE